MLLRRSKDLSQKDYEKTIAKGLDRAFEDAGRADGGRPGEVSIEAADLKIVVISDLHRGSGDRADDFRRSHRAYCAALGWYLEQGYELWLLGDVEELWENGIDEVLKEYQPVLALEGEFVPPRGRGLRRFYGNHDLDWSNAERVKTHLRRWLGETKVHEALRVRVREQGSDLGLLFFVHGHQGTPGSDQFAWLSRIAVRVGWRAIQRSQGWVATTPAQSPELRSKHDLAMFAWAKERATRRPRGDRPVLIAGHTHHPVFPGKPPERPTDADLAKLRADLARERDPARRAALRGKLELVLAERRGDLYTPPPMTPPCYFNTGCSSFPDGDVTCLEISGEELHDTEMADVADGRGKVRLIRWLNNEGEPRPHQLAAQPLRAILEEVNR
jgi:UDP-2,3-diacylglucosamine pyrophosphatase LpxH